MAFSMFIGLDVLEFVSGEAAPVTIRQIMEATGISRPTAYRTLDDLVKGGWLLVSGKPMRFSASWRVNGLGLRALEHNRVREVALPNVIELAGEARQSAFLAFFENEQTVFCDAVEVAAGRTMVTPFYHRSSLLTTASGAMWLSYQPISCTDTIIERERPTWEKLGTTEQAIRERIAVSGRRGYGLPEPCVVRNGVGSLSCMVLDATGMPVAALGLMNLGPFEPKQVQELADFVIPRATRASLELGYRSTRVGI